MKCAGAVLFGLSRNFTPARSACVVFVSLVISLFATSGLAQSATGAEPLAERETQKAIMADCYAAIGPLLERSEGELSAKVRTAYLDWAEKTALERLKQRSQVVPQDCQAEARTNFTLREAVFGAVFPPDASILQNYAGLRADLGAEFVGKYRSLAIAVAIAKRIKGVELNPNLNESENSAHFSGKKDFGGDYQPGFWTDESLQTARTKAEKDLVRGIADFMKSKQVTALELYQNADQQRRLVAYLQERHVAPSLIQRTKDSIQFGEWLKNAMVLLGQRPGARDEIPDTGTWLRHLVSIYESRPRSTPTQEGRVLSWPLFPINKAPWPLLMPLARPVALKEAKYVWETFRGEHGPDRFHTYGPFRSDVDAMPYELQPSPWFWDAWPDRIVHGGGCVSISKGAVDLYSCLAKPAVWAGQPGHANLISFQFASGLWSAEIEQAFAGGPNVTYAQWYFDEAPGTMPRFRALYDWAGAEYHLGLALAMNRGLQSYLDTRIAANIFRVLPANEKQTVGVKLLQHALEANEFNPEIWYRLAEQAQDPTVGLTLAQAAAKHRSDKPDYWQTVEEFVTRYAILARALPEREEDLHRVYTFLQTVPGLSAEDLAKYAARFVETGGQKSQADAVIYNKNLADIGDIFGQMRMGQRYEAGAGVPKDTAKAESLFGRAAAQGDKVASLALERLNPAIPASEIRVTASTVFSIPDQEPKHLVDGSGMLGGVHDNNGAAYTMWHTVVNPAAKPPERGLAPSPAWVRFDFTQPQKFNAILIWNHNQANLTNRGFRKARFYGSADGVTWFPLTSLTTVEFPRASGSAFALAVKIANAVPDRPIKSVIIAAEATNGNYGGDCFGLSAVRFVLEELEPAIPGNSITVTASSVYSPDQETRHLVDGSGMAGPFHDNNESARTMWHSIESPAPAPPVQGLAPSPAWVRFDFARPQKFDAVMVWNHNQTNLTDRGFRKTRLYGSFDGVTWFPLTSPAMIELPRANGSPLDEALTITNAAADHLIKSVIIAAEPVDGNYGSNCFGLSAVRFVVSRSQN